MGCGERGDGYEIIRNMEEAVYERDINFSFEPLPYLCFSAQPVQTFWSSPQTPDTTNGPVIPVLMSFLSPNKFRFRCSLLALHADPPARR